MASVGSSQYFLVYLYQVNSLPLIEVEVSWVVSPSADKFTKRAR